MSSNDKKKMLVVDDEPYIRQLIHKLLSQDYSLIEAANGEEAVSIAQNEIPDVILMDMLMPKMDGLSACHAIKNNKHTSKIPVIMITAIDSELNKKLAKEVWGVDGYIVKPFNSSVVMDEVRAVINRPANF
jgi:DNA-binding response OmpR family regulator